MNDLDGMIRATWERSRPVVEERLALLEQAVDDPDLRRDAESAAHRLARSLGTFGFPGASMVAAAIEAKAAAGRPFDEDVRALRASLSDR